MSADDTVIYTSAKSSAKVVALLNEQMEKISKWLQEDNLTLNVKKTVFMCFSNRKKTEKVKIRVFNEEIGSNCSSFRSSSRFTT